MAGPGGAVSHAQKLPAWAAWPMGGASTCGTRSGRFSVGGSDLGGLQRRRVVRPLRCHAAAASSAPGSTNGHIRLAMSAPAVATSAPPAEPLPAVELSMGWRPATPQGAPATGLRATSTPRCYTVDDVECAMRYAAAESATRLVALVNCYGALAFSLGDAFRGTDRHVPLGLARQGVAVDFSQAEPLPRILADALRIQAVRTMRRAARGSPLVDTSRSDPHRAAIEQQNRAWFLSHCQAVRDGASMDQVFTIDGVREAYSGLTVLANEYAEEDMYFRSVEGGASPRNWITELLTLWKEPRPKEVVPYELCCWALARLTESETGPRPVITWPSVSFEGERVFFEWAALAPSKSGRLSLLAYGNVLLCRAGDEGRIHRKISERTTLVRDIFTNGEGADA